MTRVSCVIIDDERGAREAFQGIADRYLKDRLEVLGLAASVKEGVSLIRKFNPDVVFLDIEMPRENGFKLFQYFETITFEVIFTTAFRQYAIDAIKYAALDYILKPINFIDLQEALARYERKRGSHSSRQRIDTLISNLSTGTDMQFKVAFPTLDGYQMERLNDIMYCEGEINYTRIRLAGGRDILVSRTLKEVETLLSSPYFFRIHKSYLVNLNYIRSYSKAENGVYLENNLLLPVSMRKNEEFLTVLTQWRERAGR